MSAHEEILRDPAFRQLLVRRSRLRWSLSAFLVVAYLAYAMAGLYASEFMGAAFFGSVVTWAIVLGYVIIVLSIALALVYVAWINKLTAPHEPSRGGPG